MLLIAGGSMISSLSIWGIIQDDADDIEGLAYTGDYAAANIGCSIMAWCYTMGFALVFAPLSLKMWRVTKVFTNKGLPASSHI